METLRKKVKILIDMDGILVDLCTKWLEVYNEEYGDSLTQGDFTAWDWRVDAKPGSDPHSIIKRPGFFDDLPPLPGAVDGFKELYRSHHDVIVASSPAGPDSARAKMEWCEKYLGVGKEDVSLTYHKSWFAGSCDVIVDDKPETLREWSHRGKDAYTIAYPFNAKAQDCCAFVAHDYTDTQAAWEQIVKALL